jgi:RNA polymerase sigma factor (sigma-70 family)
VVRDDAELAAFEALFIKFVQPLRQYVYGYVGSVDVAEELVQDVFLRLWDYRKKLDLTGNPGGLLHIMARHRALNYLKRERVAERVKREYVAPEIVDTGPVFPVEGQEANTLQAAVGDALGGLTPRQREVLTLRWRDGASYADIAQRLGIAPSTVASYLKEAMAHLRRVLPNAFE